MSLVFVGIGNACLGAIRKDAAGNIVSQTEPHWEPDPGGGCVAIGRMNPETMEPERDNVDFFGDWDAAAWLGRVLELVHPNRHINVPDLPSIIKKAAEDGVDVCEYCQTCNCQDCAVKMWKERNDDE